MKKKKRETVEQKVAQVYDRACRILKDYFNKHDPCQIIDGKCIFKRTEDGWSSKADTCCPMHCQYHKNGIGCTTNNLACRLFVCSYMRTYNPIFTNKISKFHRRITRIFFYKSRIDSYMVSSSYFLSREETIRRMIKYRIPKDCMKKYYVY